MTSETTKRGSFATNFGFLMAAVGSAVGLGTAIWALGLGCAAGVLLSPEVSLLDGLDDLVSRYMLPIGGLLIAIAAGRLVLPEDGLSGFRHLARSGALFGVIWQVLIRFVTPVMVTMVLLWQVGAFDPWLQGEPPAAKESGALDDPEKAKRE